MNTQNKIKILPVEIVEKISAGEVIERPVSVVKELIENSIDAGSKEIFIEVRQGGKKLIRVVDSGIGMSKEDVILSIERHTTSKINSIEDIYKIKTLGFRGEALSSISAVSKLEIITKEKNTNIGIALNIVGGEKNIKEVTALKGTSVTVKDLFYNIPVRLKFLKSNETEASHIYDLVFKLAMINYRISFKLVIDGKVVLNLGAVRSLKERIYELSGKDVLNNLIDINYEGKELHISGFISKPEYTRLQKNNIYIFVNGRLVIEKTVMHAIMTGYGELLMKNKFPTCILLIDINQHKIDVNIHPTKKEIKFVNSNLAHSDVVNAIKETLKIKKPVPHILTTSDNRLNNIPPSANTYDIFNERTDTIKELMQDFETAVKIKPIVQIKLTYILAESEDGINIIDQHVAHEKVIYEKLLKNIDKSSQILLTPISLKLKFTQSNFLKQYLTDFKDTGFDIDFFGKDTILIRGIPVCLGNINVEKVLLEIIDTFHGEFKDLKSLKEKKDSLLKSIACHSAVRAGDKLTYNEMVELINDFLKCDLPYCPHGRPGLVKIDIDEINKKFKRN